MNSPFYVGIVENRKDDPLKLGRCQVRVFGVHSENKKDVPTEDLPWAIMPNQGTSGIGFSTPPFVEGTSVLVFFIDGLSMQQPMIVQSFSGIPLDKSPFGSAVLFNQESQDATAMVAKDPDTPPVTDAGEPIPDKEPDPVDTSEWRTKLKKALGQRESGNNYAAFNRFGFIGKYQVGAAMLSDLGYVKLGTKLPGLTNPSSWTGKDGINSREDWLKSAAVQEKAIDAELDLNFSRLKKNGVIGPNDPVEVQAGYLASAHLIGPTGTRNMKDGMVKVDGNGVSGNEYYKIGYAAVAGTAPTVSPDKAVKENPYNKPAGQPAPTTKEIRQASGGSNVQVDLGFKDPQGKFPRYVKEQDTNRLSRNQNISKTIVPLKESSEDKGVPIANGQGTWNQAKTPYNAKYPFNFVYESESGHVIEIDDTPDNERIHIYHRNGTFWEIDRNGTSVTKVTGDAYQILDRNSFLHVKGVSNITVDGNANVMVGNNCSLDIGGNLDASVGGSASWRIGGNLKFDVGGSSFITAGGSINERASGNIAMDGAQIHENSGAAVEAGLGSPASTSTGDIPSQAPLTTPVRSFEELATFESDDLTDEQADIRQKSLKERGLIDENPVAGKEEKAEMVDKNDEDGKVTDCSMFVSGQINISAFVSPNFRLSDLTKGSSIRSQAGLKDTEIACNLKGVAENIGEKVKAKYPDMIITSGLRTPGSNPNSQHPKGQAIDLQFTTKSSKNYIDIAKDLASFLPYDQLILEYRSNRRNSNGEPVTWIHISYSMSGNRKQLFTMDNDRRVSNFGELKLIT